MGINSTERYHLSIFPDCLDECIFPKPSIVCMVITDIDLYLLAIFLKVYLGLDHLIRGEAIIEMHVADITLVILECFSYTVALIDGSDL